MSRSNSRQAIGEMQMGAPGFHVTVAEKQWEKVTVSEATRMRLNGESSQCMAHIKAIKAAGGVSLKESDGTDTSKDQDWPLDESCLAKCADRYCLITSSLWLVPKALIFVLPMILLGLPALLVVRGYLATLKPGTDQVHRSARFWMSFVSASLLFLPGGLLAFVSLMLDYIVYWLFGITFCILTCRFCAVRQSMKALHPYHNGPWIMLHLPDVYVALIGQMARQGLCEIAWSFPIMLLFIPWVKYYMNTNPWLHDLDHRMVTQISTTCSDVGPERVASIGQEIISRTKPQSFRARKVDRWGFVPHYPYPPAGRRYALGMQQGGGVQNPLKFLQIVHTTHANRCDGDSTEQCVLSNSCKLPLVRVMLWHNNPYHIFTGWVEASMSTGMPSQPEKMDGFEHPMWLVCSASQSAKNRDGGFPPSSGYVDFFFDYWLPCIVHEVRYSHHRMEGKTHEEALKIANDMYQEVHSKDGISRLVEDKVGLEEYNGESALDYYGQTTEEPKV